MVKLTQNQESVLGFIYEIQPISCERTSAVGIAESLGIKMSTVRSVLKRLLELDYIDRREMSFMHTHKKVKTQIHEVTDKGEQMLLKYYRKKWEDEGLETEETLAYMELKMQRVDEDLSDVKEELVHLREEDIE